jgi:hypothetical protein
LQLLLLLLLLRLGGLEQCFEVMLIHAATVTAPIMGSKATFCPFISRQPSDEAVICLGCIRLG